jgi:hypothetical protein
VTVARATSSPTHAQQVFWLPLHVANRSSDLERLQDQPPRLRWPDPNEEAVRQLGPRRVFGQVGEPSNAVRERLPDAQGHEPERSERGDRLDIAVVEPRCLPFDMLERLDQCVVEGHGEVTGACAGPFPVRSPRTPTTPRPWVSETPRSPGAVTPPRTM